MENQIILRTKELTKKYGNITAVEKININVKRGRIYGLLGRNGAGKTTIMKMILGLIAVSSGDVEVFGEKLPGNENQIYKRIGSIIETPSFYSYLTGTENLEIFARLRGTIKKDAVKSALEVTGLPYKDKKPFSSYSLGMKQRLGIANAILNDPELLILDEPTNGLDPVGIVEIRKFLQNLCREQGKTIIISSHILSEIALLADDIGIIHGGHLVKEISMRELEEKNKKYIEIKVDSVPKAAQLLENLLNCKNYAVTDKNCVEIYEDTLDPVSVANCLVTHGVGLSSLYFKHETLEDYFTALTGGARFE
ncbi:ABC transporter ATP-binding protein [Lactonifactor longoviformis]|uniref:ABC transporter ATP-binding protein n=1 Tax=Lactonifactor longoviformis TaxID=341220 RepID=UPI0036F37164